jgi:ubiquinone/menaquinone biosynthesis C-methylase UbiE
VFKFPIPPGYEENPVWTGRNFQIGSEKVAVLKYTHCNAGWNADLTEFHEQEAEAGNHYIDRASRLHACLELEKGEKDQSAVILEIGSSSGYLLKEIKTSFPQSYLIGSDCIPEPLEKIAERIPGIPLIQFDLFNCPLPDNCVDVVVALNVLEHIKDDEAALKQIYRILKPGGHAIIEVPANSQLYDFYDEQLKHFRRYDLRGLKQMSHGCGFVFSKSTHLGFCIYPAFKLIKLRNKRENKHLDSYQKQITMKTQIRFGGPIVNRILFAVMLFELYLGKTISYPWGIRCALTLQKPHRSITR